MSRQREKESKSERKDHKAIGRRDQSTVLAHLENVVSAKRIFGSLSRTEVASYHMVPSRTEPWTWKLPKTTPLTDLFLRLSTIEFKILVERGENLELRLTMVTEPVLDGPF